MALLGARAPAAPTTSAAETPWTAAPPSRPAAASTPTSRHDIIFISSGALTNEGHFANVGDTRRLGLELSGAGTLARTVRWGAAYTYLRATFDTPLVLSSPNHPDARAGEIPVGAGRPIPGIPPGISRGIGSCPGVNSPSRATRYTVSARFRRSN